jgi:hypothetical protein
MRKVVLAKANSKLKFEKINYQEFERLGSSSEAYFETEIDGHNVIVCHYTGRNKAENFMAMYYTQKKFGTVCKGFTGEDEVDYAEKDPNWPF